MASGNTGRHEGSSMFPDIEKLRSERIRKKLQTGCSAGQVAIWLVCSTVNRTLKDATVDTLCSLVTTLQDQLILEIDEKIDLLVPIENNRNATALDMLCGFLQKKGDEDILEFIHVLQQNESLARLGQFVHNVLTRCQGEALNIPHSEESTDTPQGNVDVIIKVPGHEDRVIEEMPTNEHFTNIIIKGLKVLTIRKSSILIQCTYYDQWSLQDLQYDITSGLFLLRFISWLQDLGLELSREDVSVQIGDISEGTVKSKDFEVKVMEKALLEDTEGSAGTQSKKKRRTHTPEGGNPDREKPHMETRLHAKMQKLQEATNQDEGSAKALLEDTGRYPGTRSKKKRRTHTPDGDKPDREKPHIETRLHAKMQKLQEATNQDEGSDKSGVRTSPSSQSAPVMQAYDRMENIQDIEDTNEPKQSGVRTSPSSQSAPVMQVYDRMENIQDIEDTNEPKQPKHPPPNMDVPIPFITNGSNGKMEVNEQCSTILCNATESLSVISIVGKYRTGKSYILNRFFESNSGFTLGPTIKAETKGIWLWARPHPQDPSRTLVLLDTEGLHDVKKGDKKHDMQLFTLAILLSNCLIYNIMGPLDDALIHELHLVTKLTKNIKVKEGLDEHGIYFSKFFPYLFFILRDFFLDLKLTGVCTPDDYLEDALVCKTGRGDDIYEYNEPRQCIRDFFPQRKCSTICRPVEDEKKLQNLDIVQEQDIRPKFFSETAETIDVILTEAKEMSVNGNPINGKSFIELARFYVNCLNNNAIPCIGSAANLLKNKTCHEALEGALDVFVRVMSGQVEGKFPIEYDAMIKSQKAAFEAANDHYKKKSVFHDDQEFTKRLAMSLESKFEDFKEKNNRESEQKCENVWAKVFSPVNDQIKAGEFLVGGGHKRYKMEMEIAIEKYKNVPSKGPLADKVLQKHMEALTSTENSIINADKKISEYDKENAKALEKIHRQQEFIEMAEEEKRRALENLARQQKENKKMVKDVMTEANKQKEKVMAEFQKTLSEKEKECTRLISEGLTHQAELYKQMIADLKDERAAQKKKYDQQMEEFKKFHQSSNKKEEKYRQQSLQQAEKHNKVMEEMKRDSLKLQQKLEQQNRDFMEFHRSSSKKDEEHKKQTLEQMEKHNKVMEEMKCDSVKLQQKLEQQYNEIMLRQQKEIEEIKKKLPKPKQETQNAVYEKKKGCAIM